MLHKINALYLVIGIDTIRFLTTLTALEKQMIKLGLEYQKEVNLSLVDRFKKEIIKADRTKQVKKEDFDLDVVKVSKDKSLLGYILVKKNYQSITNSKKQKRAKNHFRQIIFTSLHQPSKQHHDSHLKATYKILSSFIARFKVESFDISVDGLKSLVICNKNKYFLNGIFDMFINKKSIVEIYQTSYYINNPYIKNPNDRFSLERILVYDKYLKESQRNGKPLSWHKLKKLPIDWKRLELTIKVTNEKFNISLLDEVMDYISQPSKSFFVSSSFDKSFLQIQKELLGLKG